jgi:hypothetical protein
MDVIDAVRQIASDVEGWLVSMPENFKTSTHALSRPKFGVAYVLKNDDVRSRVGADMCDELMNTIESQWSVCKGRVVIPPSIDVASDAICDDTEKDVHGDDALLVDVLSDGLREMLRLHYNDVVAGLFDSLMAIKRSTP